MTSSVSSALTISGLPPSETEQSSRRSLCSCRREAVDPAEMTAPGVDTSSPRQVGATDEALGESSVAIAVTHRAPEPVARGGAGKVKAVAALLSER